MSTPLTDTMSQISTDWEALVPPDDVTITYHEVQGRRRLTGVAGHRAFSWGPARRSDNVLIGEGCGVAEWELKATMRIRVAGKSMAAIADASACELSLLLGAVEQRTNWPTGVYEVLVDPTDYEEDEGGDLLLDITLRVTAGVLQ